MHGHLKVKFEKKKMNFEFHLQYSVGNLTSCIFVNNDTNVKNTTADARTHLEVKCYFN